MGQNYLTVADVRAWLEQEQRDLARAHRLRNEEASRILTDFEQGRITPVQAEERLYDYVSRWDDGPIPGVRTADGMSDEEVYRTMDEARTKWRSDTIRSAPDKHRRR